MIIPSKKSGNISAGCSFLWYGNCAESIPIFLNDPRQGEEARKLFDDANRLLDRIIREKALTANGVIGIFPANSVGDDIEVIQRHFQNKGDCKVYQPQKPGTEIRWFSKPLSVGFHCSSFQRNSGLSRCFCRNSRHWELKNCWLNLKQILMITRASWSKLWPTGLQRHLPNCIHLKNQKRIVGLCAR